MQRINELTIVGGGTAGWLTATYLATFLNLLNDNKDPVKITLIESPNIPTVGVGESTLPSMPRLLQVLGINEAEFFRRTNATFKCAGRFVNWNVDKDGKPVTFITPFDVGDEIMGIPPAYYFNQFGSVTGSDSLVDNIMPNEHVINNFKSPREDGMEQYDGVINYSYHLDAGAFGKFLQEIAIERGVNHIRDDVVNVNLDDKGYVASLDLKEGGKFPIKFVIDCSGFKGLIIREALGEPFMDYKKYFLCDRALPVMTTHKNENKIMPATTAIGQDAGWIWNVPLYNRMGNGYVFSSQFISDDEAMDTVMKSLGNPEPLNSPRVLSFDVGATERAWVKNCLAIGLSGSFVEPLEATAIGMVDKVARWFSSYYPGEDNDPSLAKQLNKLVRKMHEETRDFIFMHYYLSNREDTPFWLAVKNEVEMPETLKERLDLWRHVMPTPDTTLGNVMFGWENYLFALSGKGYFSDVKMPMGASLSLDAWKHYSEFITNVKQHAQDKLIGHHDLLTRIRNS